MIIRSVPPVSAWVLMCVLTSFPLAANACTACMGDPNSKAAGAINAAIFLMIGFVALMLGSFVSFAWYLSKRATTGSIVPDASAAESSDQTDNLT